MEAYVNYSIMCDFNRKHFYFIIKNVIEWFLAPIPFVPEARVAAMFSLTFVLIPLIFDQASEMREAQKARCIDERKTC